MSYSRLEHLGAAFTSLAFVLLSLVIVQQADGVSGASAYAASVMCQSEGCSQR